MKKKTKLVTLPLETLQCIDWIKRCVSHLVDSFWHSHRTTFDHNQDNISSLHFLHTQSSIPPLQCVEHALLSPPTSSYQPTPCTHLSENDDPPPTGCFRTCHVNDERAKYILTPLTLVVNIHGSIKSLFHTYGFRRASQPACCSNVAQLICKQSKKIIQCARFTFWITITYQNTIYLSAYVIRYVECVYNYLLITATAAYTTALLHSSKLTLPCKI
jgi:hypothetical protein